MKVPSWFPETYPGEFRNRMIQYALLLGIGFMLGMTVGTLL